MKITVKKTVESVVEITLPYFFKTKWNYVAVLNENGGFINVEVGDGVKDHKWVDPFIVFADQERTEITAKEFHEAMLTEINNLTLKLHNIAALQQNEFIKNETLKSEGY